MHSNLRLRLGLLSVTVLALAGCSSGGSSTITVASEPFEGAVTSADYIGRTFPVYVVIGEAGDPSGSTVAGRGSVTYNADDTLTLLLPGQDPVTLTPTGASASDTTYTAAGADPITVTVTDFASTSAFRLVSSSSDELLVLGGFGFETLAGDRGASGTYDLAGGVFLTTPDTEDFLPVAGDGTLTADFGTGEISGTMLSTDPVSIGLAGDGDTPDELAMLFMLDEGQITPDGFTGEVGLSAELVVDGSGAPVPLDATMSGSSAEGAFFGEEAAAVSGIFEGDIALADDGTPLIDFDASGFFSGPKTGP